MSDWPAYLPIPRQRTVVCPAYDTLIDQGVPASTAWPTANTAYFFPFRIEQSALIVKLWWLNGTNITGNRDAGIYTEDGTRVVSTGSTAAGTASLVKEVDTTDTMLAPGVYYMALASDSTTGRIARASPGIPECKAMGMAEMASAFALPATVTFATIATSYISVCGYATRVTI